MICGWIVGLSDELGLDSSVVCDWRLPHKLGGIPKNEVLELRFALIFQCVFDPAKTLKHSRQSASLELQHLEARKFGPHTPK